MTQENELEDKVLDLYIIYILGGYNEIYRNFLLSAPKDLRFFPLFALDRFPSLCLRITRKPYKKEYDAIISKWKDAVSKDLLDLWRRYEEDPEYVKALSRPLAILAELKRLYKAPPLFSYELRLAFGALECVMLTIPV